MIGTIDIQCNAAHPNMQLQSLYAFLNSPSNIRIIGIPKRIGLWTIEKVYISATYPDNSINSVECVKNGSIWVGTIPGSTTIGRSLNGFSVTADGIDENGNSVTGYVLGKGDVVILDTDGTITEGQITYYLHLLSSEPDTAKIGDTLIGNNVLSIYNGSYWMQINGGDVPLADLSNTFIMFDTQQECDNYVLNHDTFCGYLSNGVFHVYSPNTNPELAGWKSTQDINLSNYYTKSETSSNAELSNKFSEYYTKSETSSNAELSNKFSEYYTKSETSSSNQLQPEFVKSKYYLLKNNIVKSGMAVDADKYPIVLIYTGNETPEIYTFIQPFSSALENENYYLDYIEITEDSQNYTVGDILIGIDGWSTATVVNANGQTNVADWTVTFNNGTITKSNIVNKMNLIQLDDNTENIISIDNSANCVYYSFPDGIVENNNRYAIDMLINLSLISCSTAPETVYMYKNGNIYSTITAYSDDGEFPETNVLSNGTAKTLFGFTEISEGNFAVSGKKLEVIV